MPQKILIVDDDIDSLKLIGLMLQRHGYEILAASAGVQALGKAASDQPDLIILDIMMPDMDGYEVCRRLRADQATRAIPIIMFTAKTLVDDKVAGFEAGADDYLTKPTHPAELASRVKAILARSAGKRKPPPQKGMTIGFLGAKGGVGTTTIALNTAAALLMAGEQPVVADFRPGAGSLGLLLGIDGNTGMSTVLSRAAVDIHPAVVERELILHATNLRALLSSANPREALVKYPAEAAVAVVNSLRMLGRPTVFDLGSGYSSLISRLQIEMDQLVLVIDPFQLTLLMARELLNELESTVASVSRVHIVVVNHSRAPGVQTHWNEVEQILAKEIRAIISDAPDLVNQAVQAATPLVMVQPNAIVSNQIIKLSEDISARTHVPAGSQLMA